MRHTLMQGTAVLLVALTVWAISLVLMTTLGNEPTFFASGWFSESGAREVTVAEVLASNRLRLSNGQEVLLAAIEVPSVGQPFAEEGKQATIALTRNVQLRLEGEPEEAYIYLPGGQSLQEMLLSGGYARLARGLPQSDLVARLRSAEAQAQNQGLGVWQGGPPAMTFPTLVPTSGPVTCDGSLLEAENAITPEEAKDHLDEVATVIFYAVRVERRNSNVTVLAGPGADSFGMLIPSGLASTINDDPGLLFLNRCIAIEGRIERGVEGGPRISLRALNEVMILR